MMQHDLSTMTPATRAVFDAVHYLGQGNVHELADQSGKARSTVDKAIKSLSDAGLIVPVDTDADPAEGVPTRWTMAEGVAESITADDSDSDTGTQSGHGDAGTPGDVEPGSDDADSSTDELAAGNEMAIGDQPDSGASPAADTADENSGEGEANAHADDDDTDGSDDMQRSTIAVVQPSRPGDRKVMTIKAVLAEHGDDGATLDEIVNESGIGHSTTSRLLTAMEQADAARRLPGTPSRWITGPTKASEVDPNPEPIRCILCYQVIKGVTETPEAVAQVQALIRPDGTLHVVAEDEAAHVVRLPKRLPARAASTTTTATFRRADATVNADGSQPFGRGELEKLTLAVLAANPGRAMTPQQIASEISGLLGGRTVSPGAVRNNCTTAAAKPRAVIEMVSDAPLTFAFPAPAGGSKPGNGDEFSNGDATREIDASAELS